MPDPDRFLLDTHTLVWLATDDSRLTPKVHDLVLDPENELFLSASSIWELAIKKSLGRVEMQIPLGEFIRSQLEALAVSLLQIGLEHALGVEALPFHHRDPFDRLIISTATTEDLSIISRDTIFDDYSVFRVW